MGSAGARHSCHGAEQGTHSHTCTHTQATFKVGLTCMFWIVGGSCRAQRKHRPQCGIELTSFLLSSNSANYSTTVLAISQSLLNDNTSFSFLNVALGCVHTRCKSDSKQIQFVGLTVHTIIVFLLLFCSFALQLHTYNSAL